MKRLTSLFALSILGLCACAQKGPTYALNVEAPSGICPDLPVSRGYAEGEAISFKVGIVTDVTFRPYLNEEPLSAYESDGELGGYDYYSFSMPAFDSSLVITSDPYFFDKEYSFEDVVPWVKGLKKESITGIRVEKGYSGMDPATYVPDILYSEDPRDISGNLRVLEEPLKKDEAYRPTPGGYYARVTFYRGEEENILALAEDHVHSPQSFASGSIPFAFARENHAEFGIQYPAL